MNKIMNFPMLMLSLIGIAVAVYLFLPAPVERQGAVADITERVQLETEKHSSAIYNEDSSPSSQVVSPPTEGDSPVEMENQELESQYLSEDGSMPPVPDGGDW